MKVGIGGRSWSELAGSKGIGKEGITYKGDDGGSEKDAHEGVLELLQDKLPEGCRCTHISTTHHLLSVTYQRKGNNRDYCGEGIVERVRERERREKGEGGEERNAPSLEVRQFLPYFCWRKTASSSDRPCSIETSKSRRTFSTGWAQELSMMGCEGMRCAMGNAV